MWLWAFVEVAAGILGAGAACLTLAGFAGGIWWLFDLASHFRVQYLVALCLACMVLWWRQRRFALVLGTMAALNGVAIAALYVAPQAATASTGHTKRLVMMNVLSSNLRYDLVSSYIVETQPDVLVLLEVNDAWLTGLDEALRPYPHRVTRARSGNFGIALFSRLPLSNTQIVDPGQVGVPTIVTTVMSEAGQFEVIATHAFPPWGSEGAELRDRQLADLAQLAGGRTVPMIVLGDLNATPWSHAFRAMLRDSGLTRCGRGINATWPTFSLILRIPIDHCLHDDRAITHRYRVGWDVGSDHLPIAVDVQITVRKTMESGAIEMPRLPSVRLSTRRRLAG